MSEAAENEKLRSMRYADAMERLQVILEEIDDFSDGIDVS